MTKKFPSGIFHPDICKTCSKTRFYAVDVFTVFLRLTKCVLCEYHMTLEEKKFCK